MSFGHAFASVLPTYHQLALQEACDVLIDAYFDDLVGADESAWDFGRFFIADLLPRRYLPKYTPMFAKRFLVCLTTAAWKLNQLYFISFACVAEEIAAWTIVQYATSLLEEDKIRADFEPLIDRAFEDTDFLNLYDPEMDGIDESPLAAVMGMTSLAFNDWFEPSNSTAPHGVVHPYAQQEDELEDAEGCDEHVPERDM